jgi:DNA-binding transcriptional ArsR family regulator
MTNIHSIEALSDPTRRKLFERLRLGPCSVSELVQAVPVSQPAVSQHLRVLREARLVQVHKQGQQRIYSINRQGLAELRTYIESFWDTVLGAYQEAADKSTTEETGK